MKRLLVPEVIQSSVMDCGPASLKALFGGFGLYLSYGRLREACQTDVDGTSIDTLETMAQALGLDAAQVVIPSDLVLLPDVGMFAGYRGACAWPEARPTSSCCGACMVRWCKSWIRERAASGCTGGDFWSPSISTNRWSRARCGKNGREAMCSPRAWKAGCARSALSRNCGTKASDKIAQSWTRRFVWLALFAMRASYARGAEAEQFLNLCAQNPEQIPPEFWTVRKTTDDDEHLMMRGAVLVVAAGKREEASTEPLPQSLEAVRNEPPTRVWLPVWEAVRESGWLATGLIVLALLASAAGTVFEPLLFRGFFDLARHLKLPGQRIGAIIAMICFLGGLLALEWPAVTGLLRLGRHLEMRLRTRILMKIPRLHDRHFQSRLISDMAFRAHTLQLLRHLPEFAGLFVRLTASLIFAAAGIAWFYPGAALPAVLAVIVAVGVPLLFQPALASRDLRFREFSGALSRFYLDALLGLRPIQAHGAAGTLRTLHSEQLGQWAEAGLRLQSVFVRAEVLQMAVTYMPVIALVYREALRTSSPAGLLLLAYWAVSIPTLGQELASIAWDMPALRNTLWRLLEPLGAPEEEVPEAASCGGRRPAASVWKSRR